MMMKTIANTIFTVFIFLFSILHIQPVLAHGDDARIEISPERLNPGGVLDIRGVGIEPEAEIALTLVGPQSETPLGAMTADAEGLFLVTITLPVDLAEGAYVIRARTEDGHAIESPELTIRGSADLGSADGQPREDDDGLLAPMPTVGAGVPTPMMSSASVTGNSQSTGSPTIPYSWIVAGVGFVAISVLVLVLKKR